MPGSADEPASAVGSATASAAREGGQENGLTPRSLRPRVATRRDQLPDAPEETADAVRQDEHEEDQDDAVDDRRPARLLRLLDDAIGQQRAEILALRPERQERR